MTGELDPATSTVLRDALHAFDTGPDPVDEPAGTRSLGERWADALGDMARHALGRVDGDGDADVEADVGSVAPAPRSARTANLVIDMPSLAGRTGTDLDGIVAALDGRPVSVWAAEQLLCGSWVSALVTDAEGAVIDATERIADFTDTQRRLIAARDQHCVFPACDLPASWCDVHHVHWRSQGGGRHLDNGVLLCRRHHTLLHRPAVKGRRWRLHRSDDGGWHATSPTGRTWTGHPPDQRHEVAAGREPPDEAARAA